MKSIFLNRQQISTPLHGVTFKNTIIFTHIKISNLIEEEHNVLITLRGNIGYFTFKSFLFYVIYKDFCVLVCDDMFCYGR